MGLGRPGLALRVVPGGLRINMSDLIVRFILAGSLAVAIPLIGRKFGPGIAAVVRTAPTITFVSLLFTDMAYGHELARRIALYSIAMVPALLTCYSVIGLVGYRIVPGPPAIIVGVLAWVAIAVPTIYLVGIRVS